MKNINIIGLVGSLRKGSMNRMLMEAARTLAPAGMAIEIAEIGNLPLFNQDFEGDPPKEVQGLKEKIIAADGVLIATPEYNRSIPGVLKNAIDWTSRPYGKSAWTGKVVAVMGASGGVLGAALAQQALKEVLLYLDTRVIGQPEFFLGGAHEKFNEAGILTDEGTKQRLVKLLETLAAEVRRGAAD